VKIDPENPTAYPCYCLKAVKFKFNGGFDALDLCTSIHAVQQCAGTRSMHARIAAQEANKGKVSVACEVLEGIQKSLKTVVDHVDTISKGVPVVPLPGVGGPVYHLEGSLYSVAELAAIPIAARIDYVNGDLGCTMCAKLFRSESSLARHLAGHQGLGAFVCLETGCGKKFTSRRGLLEHEKSHNPEHKCEECESVFSHKQSLIRHVASKHGEADVEVEKTACQFCGRQFARAPDCVGHSARCKDNPDKVKGFPCLHQGCVKAFYTLRERNHHQTTKHKFAARKLSATVSAAEVGQGGHS
jgi:uncharacterized C2H2 Zn-finger protein